MDIIINGKSARLTALADGNAFPDLLFFAAGKVAAPGGKAKFKVKVGDNGTTLKTWTRTVEHTELQGTPFGNFFGSEIISRDDLTGNFQIEVQIDGAPVNPAGLIQVDVDALKGLGATFDNGAGVTGVVGVLFMA